ncbi:hypothetical protein K458DRAFT_462205 [Lentithecium fluviatile CBS 122367]|uniref:Heterokaryon incompatibility domain-containing protein n=1 Tax=Lentithecium fluviatile CBS 122367 TaxID=1168545 RepID=A0A6G1JGD7_9PLEO|nr:hypothetical protein K458DRAFT_462205 [Lentithecium fluviatile CBS 122367]
MRLLHSETLEFHEFYDSSIPQYAILSHTWGDGEMSYQDMCQLQKVEAYRKRKGRGHAKIKNTAKLTRLYGYDYFWVDRCATDKNSSAELQEAINPMYRWYYESSRCFVFLEDVDAGPEGYIEEQLEACRWIGRG